MSDVWSGLVGQDQAINTLRAAATSPTAMTHAWLVTGPPGSGRSNMARAFAASLLCADQGCGQCRVCRSVLADAHPDVTVLRTEKVTISIEEVRDLVQVGARSPNEGQRRVILVEDADRMLERTTNVLLKAIEEPAPSTVWVLCAPSPQDVLVTLRSRCRPVVLRVPPTRAVADLLVAQEGLDDATALECARAAQSHVGLARRLARDPEARKRRDRVVAIAAGVRGVADAVLGAAEIVETADEEASAQTAERDAAERSELLASLGATGVARLPPPVRAQVRQLEENQKRRARRRRIDVIDRSLLDIASVFRDVLLSQLGAVTEVMNSAQVERVAEVARATSPEQTLRRIDAVTTARRRVAGNVSPLLAVEALMVDLRVAG